MACNLPCEVDIHKGEEGGYLVICEQLYSELNDAISGSMALDEIIKKQEYIGQKIDINSDFLSLLTLKSLDQLIEAIDDGRNIFEIEADLEESQVIGEEFVNWLYSSGTIISNKTIFHHKNLGQGEVEATKLRFLVTFNIPVQEVKQFLGEMDEERDLFVLSKCKYFDDVNESKIPDDSNSIIKKIPFPGATNAANETLRVNSKNLDKFVNQVGELVTLHNMMSHTLYDNDYLASLRRGKNILRELKSSVNVSNDELNALIQCLDNIEIHNQEVQQINSRLKTTLGNVQEGVMDLRVVPVATVFNRLPRLVRDLSNAQGKKVQLNITGDDVQIDKGLVEVLVEPLMHIVRNCIDHGIESAEERASSAKPEIATLTLNTIQHNGSLLLELSDDGRGLNYEKILQQAIRNNTLSSKESVNLTEQELTNLIFLPGFSTSDEVTETSGRGVGMDVVKTRITQFGGSIDINSKPGEGTKFILRLPLSVAIQGVVLVGSGGQTYAIPERNVTEVIKASDNDLQVIQGQSVILLRNMTLPLYRLDKLMGNDICNNDSLDQEFDVVIVSNGKFRIGLIVDKIMERQEVFIRDLHSDIAAIPGVGGVSILGDGSVIIILDCENLFDLAAKNAHSLSSLVNA